ncbi:PhzF family phenazine biosynthesis protein [Sphaerisporangium sp. TRM90804]|uniref:PhzF family phenazine biosynthesis protein n=1 Tax=Sphaerisporangium sp. TRM90804 TaxID=3031113 RepID=UPI00244CD2FE|nr:PhzF family phenazine biosynthesis protein [Sphaerisporangium sp. TRM90804]MDH2430444.1 PhzF family phenazine biosynthesis protein [Sphaerisporangium sp. TRM90804]
MRVYTVDSFTEEPFKGNPAAVCLLDSPRSDGWMQALAREMRHSETAFVQEAGEGRPYSLRWFTPAVEVTLCGHATLAAAHILYSLGAASGSIEFSTKSGILTTELLDHGRISMDFPSHPPVETPAPEALAKALGTSPVWVGRGRLDLLVEVESERAVRELAPDMASVAAVDARAVCVTARAGESSPGADYVSRFFAPNAGVDEDPVTGSAHCMLAPYWAAKLGAASLVGAQLSERGGVVHTTVRGDRTLLAGDAVTIWSGELHV